MPWRIYSIKQKYTKKDGTVSIYKLKNRKWINSNKRYKPQKRGLEKKSVYSSRFGFLELYNRKEQQELICPSGYSISQCFNMLHKLWAGYRIALNGADGDRSFDKVKQYAKAIQDVQKDMGIKTASFPHIGIFGDEFILNNKNGERIVSRNDSALKKKQEEFEKREAENSRKIQEVLQKPDIEKGETIVTFADDYGPSLMEEPYGDKAIPNLLEPDESKGEEIISIPDNIPFQEKLQKPEIEKGETIVTFADDYGPSLMEEPYGDKAIPNLLEPDESKGEEIISIPDKIPFTKIFRKRAAVNSSNC